MAYLQIFGEQEEIALAGRDLSAVASCWKRASWASAVFARLHTHGRLQLATAPNLARLASSHHDPSLRFIFQLAANNYTSPVNIPDKSTTSTQSWTPTRQAQEDGGSHNVSETRARLRTLQRVCRLDISRVLTTNAVLLADIISTVEFDSTGNYLATGDKGGRVVLFERNEMVKLGPAALECPC